MTILLVTGACSPLMDHLARESAKAREIPRFGVLPLVSVPCREHGVPAGPESSYMSRDFFLDELYDIATAQE